MRFRSLVALVLLLVPNVALADMWCAAPLIVHEWGVHVFRGDGQPATALPLPPWFHTTGPVAPRSTSVRALPPDSGIRTLPVLQFYAAGARSVPIGIEVGFTHGPASVWFPQVDTLVPFALASGAVAAQQRVALQVQRAQRLQRQRLGEPVAADPTRQLVWDRLTLNAEPSRAALATDVGWVKELRAVDALWVESPSQSERFVFYEGETREVNPIRLARADDWDPKRRAYVVENTSAHPVHDLIITHRDGATLTGHVAFIAARSQARVVLAPAEAGALEARLRASLVTPKDLQGVNICVSDRDPAQPFELASSHKLFAAEVDALVSAWRPRFFEQRGTTVLWREDLAALTEALPLSIYTDMFHYVLLSRASLKLWEGVTLP